MNATYQVGDFITTVYDYDRNSGKVIEVTSFGSGTDEDPLVFEYLVRMDVEHRGDGEERRGTEVCFHDDELYRDGCSLLQLDVYLNDIRQL